MDKNIKNISIMNIDNRYNRQLIYNNIYNNIYDEDKIINIFDDYIKKYNKEIKKIDYSLYENINITKRYRFILIQWVYEIKNSLKISDETYHMCIILIDLFLQEKKIKKEKLQLLACACMFISCKYNGIDDYRCDDFINISANSFTKQELINMEENILNTFNFNINYINTQHIINISKLILNHDIYIKCQLLSNLLIIHIDFSRINHILLSISCIKFILYIYNYKLLFDNLYNKYITKYYHDNDINNVCYKINIILKQPNFYDNIYIIKNSIYYNHKIIFNDITNNNLNYNLFS
jgi:hypothetical protein